MSNSLPISLALIGLLGIPHGANDHLLFFQLTDESQKRHRRAIKFFAAYLGLMSLYGFLWYVMPAISLILFLTISAFHFGQSHVVPLAFPSEKWRTWSHLLSGIFVLFTPILAHLETALPVIAVLLRVEWVLPSGFGGFWIAVSISVLMTGYWSYLLLTRQVDQKSGRQELLNTLFLACLFLTTPLWIAFAVYFALWHALPSMEDQIRFFREARKNYRLSTYAIEVMPFTFLALLGLWVVWLLSGKAIDTPFRMGLLFAFIAIITLPHTLLMTYLYRRLSFKTFSSQLK